MADAATPLHPGLDPDTRIDWRNLIWAGLAIGIMIVAIVSEDLWFLNFVHVITGLLWTGIDLFMGFVIGPIMRRVSFPTRQAITTRLMPRIMFIMPTLAIIAPTAGWFLANMYGYLDLEFPELWWLIAALVITTILSIQGIAILLPTNILVSGDVQARTRRRADRPPDAPLCSGGRLSGADAGRDHRDHGPLRDGALRVLNLVLFPACFETRALRASRNTELHPFNADARGAMPCGS